MTARARRGTGFDWSQVRVGVVIIVGLLILAFGILQVGALFDVFADRYTLFMPVRTTGGLIEGAPVTLAGKRVGQVDDIEFIPLRRQRGADNLMLSLEIDEDVQEHIREDSEGRIRTQGLVGEMYVDIDPGTLPYPVLQPGDTLPSRPTVDIDRVLAKAYEVLVAADSTLGDIRELTAGLRRGEGTLGRLLVDESLYERALTAADEAAVLLDRMNRGEGTFGRLVRDPTLYNRLVDAAARVDTLGAAILEAEGTLGRLITSDTAHQALLGLLTEARGTVVRADTAIGNINDLLVALGADGIELGAGGTLQKLLTDPTLYEEFLRAVVELQRLIVEIRERPEALRPEINLDIF